MPKCLHNYACTHEEAQTFTNCTLHTVADKTFTHTHPFARTHTHTPSHARTHNELATKRENWNGKPRMRWYALAFDSHLRKLLRMYCPGNAGMEGNDRADRLASRKIRSVEELKDITCGHKAEDITPSIAWRRGVGRGSARQSSLKGP